MAADRVIPLPMVNRGRFYLLQTATGSFVCFDPWAPLGKGAVGGRHFKTISEATKFAEQCEREDPRLEK